MFNTGEKLASIQQKIHTIQDRLEANRIYHEEQENGYCGVSCYSWKRFLNQQTFYAHLLKIFTLFALAVAHLIYMQSFLTSFSAMEDYNQRIISKYPHQQFSPHGLDTRAVYRQVEMLADYKKTTWMTIGAMCIALSTSCFFLFILPISQIRRLNVNLMRIIDIIAFGTIPIMLLNRQLVADNLQEHLQEALQTGHKLAPADKLMNTLICTIHYREGLPFCSKLVLESIFPVILLKYLLILTILTLAYIALAYLIEYCIRHWFPPSNDYDDCELPKSSPERCCHNKVYMPIIIHPKNPLIHA
uniref:Gustatory receptor n=1 Tax=Panagrolaimus sp. JU765 TaxID=591449 RepID=A0AC34PZ36_9BILA